MSNEDDGMVDIYIDGRLWTRMSRELFEQEWTAAAPAREAIARDFESLKKESLGE